MPWLMQRRKLRGAQGFGSGLNPASLGWTSWVRAPYGGAPWLGTASAGPSGSRSWAGGGSPPTVGTTLNGWAGARFSGAQALTASGFDLGGLLGASPAGWTFVTLFSPQSLLAAGSPVFDRQQLLTDSGGWVGVSVDVNGVAAWAGDGSAGNVIKATAQVPLSLATPVVICARWTGTQLQCRVGKTGSMTAGQVAFGAMFSPFSTIATNNVFVGQTYAAANFLDGTIWEHGVLPLALTDAQLDAVCAAIGSRYGV